MNIFEYPGFREDVECFLSQAIKLFNLSVNTSLNVYDKPINNFVFLQNTHCTICLDNISAFPYPSISESFFIHDKLDLQELDPIKLRLLLQISDEFICNYMRWHQSSFESNVEFKNKEKGAYLYGIKLMNDLLIEFYTPLLSGEINIEQLLKIIKV